MIWFVLILLLLALAAGILGAVLKVALVIVLSLMLAAVILGFVARIWWRRRIRDLQSRFSGYPPGSSGGRMDTSGTVRDADPSGGGRDDRDDPPALRS